MQLLLASVLLAALSAYLVRQFRDRAMADDDIEAAAPPQIDAAEDVGETLKAA